MAFALFLDPLITLITSSKIERAFIRPSKMCIRALATFKSNSVLLVITSLWKAM